MLISIKKREREKERTKDGKKKKMKTMLEFRNIKHINSLLLNVKLTLILLKDHKAPLSCIGFVYHFYDSAPPPALVRNIILSTKILKRLICKILFLEIYLSHYFQI